MDNFKTLVTLVAQDNPTGRFNLSGLKRIYDKQCMESIKKYLSSIDVYNAKDANYELSDHIMKLWKASKSEPGNNALIRLIHQGKEISNKLNKWVTKQNPHHYYFWFNDFKQNVAIPLTWERLSKIIALNNDETN